jgi:hypothetical protein
MRDFYGGEAAAGLETRRSLKKKSMHEVSCYANGIRTADLDTRNK